MSKKKIDYKSLICNVPRLDSMEPVGSYPFNANDMDDYLTGALPVPCGSSVREYNGVSIDEITYYARDNFEAMEALKSSIRNAKAQVESSGDNAKE